MLSKSRFFSVFLCVLFCVFCQNCVYAWVYILFCICLLVRWLLAFFHLSFVQVCGERLEISHKSTTHHLEKKIKTTNNTKPINICQEKDKRIQFPCALTLCLSITKCFFLLHWRKNASPLSARLSLPLSFLFLPLDDCCFSSLLTQASFFFLIVVMVWEDVQNVFPGKKKRKKKCVCALERRMDLHV